MSEAGRCRITRIKILESNIRGTTLRSRGVILTGRLKERAVQMYTSLWLVWNQLSRVDGGTLGPLDEYFSRWRNTIGRIDIEVALDTLKTAADLFDEIVAGGTLFQWSWRRFKHGVKVQNHAVDIGVILPLERLVASCFTGNGETASIRAVRQCLGLLGKTAFSEKDVELSDKALDKFVLVNRMVENRQASKFITDWFHRYLNLPNALHEEFFRHGNGRTKEVRRSQASNPGIKYSHLRSDPLLRMAFSHFHLDFDFPPGEIREALVSVVPKKATAYRTIVFEPTTLQWFQQGVAAWLWEWINHHPYLSRRIDQEGNGVRNNRLAQEGSVRGDFATIDSSNASDLVSFQFLSSGLRLCPNLRIAWEASRSQSAKLTYTNGRVRKEQLRMSGGMGSALTFPMESLTFCSIVEEAITLQGGNPRKSRYVVHGDDIVVETCYAEGVCERLTHYGFQVNRTKSFIDRKMVWNFRESCGGFYLDGDPIDILKYPRKVTTWVGIVTSWPSQAIAIANDAFMYGLSDLRTYVIGKLLRLPKKLQPMFSSDWSDTSCVFSPSATNFHLIRRKGCQLEKPYVYGTVTTRYEKASNVREYDAYRLYEWLRIAAVERKKLAVNDEATQAIAVCEGINARARWRQQKLR